MLSGENCCLFRYGSTVFAVAIFHLDPKVLIFIEFLLVTKAPTSCRGCSGLIHIDDSLRGTLFVRDTLTQLVRDYEMAPWISAAQVPYKLPSLG